MDTAGQIIRFIRWKDWGPGKLTILWSICLYIAVAYNLPFEQFALTFVVFMIFAASQSALGYVLNNWGDRELDRKQFKSNPFNGRSRLEAVLSLTLVIVTAFVTGLPLALRPGFSILWLAWVVATVSYSIEPARLKTKGVAGLAVSFVAQWLLPVLISFAAFVVADGWDMWLLALALMVTGATLEIAHQRYDRERDRLARAETFAAGLSDAKIDRIYAIVLVLDKFAIGLVIAIDIWALRLIQTDWAWALAAILGSAYLVLFALTLVGTFRSLSKAEIVDPYYGPRLAIPSPAQLMHETLLNFGAPLVMGIAATIRSPLYAIVLGLFLIWRVVLGGADWRWPLRALRQRVLK
ncbi:MAG TPA: UbiA family prenyltransferase [Anaerolineales bacterium]